jgi:hypothetical protein
MSGTDLAPAHQTWVCAGCGKTSRSRYGFDASGKSVADAGWDESCMLRAVLCEPTGAEVGMQWRAAGGGEHG